MSANPKKVAVVESIAPRPAAMVPINDGKRHRRVPIGTPVPDGWKSGRLRTKKNMVRAAKQVRRRPS